MSCDLHTHTYYSDGSDSPEELVLKAKRLGLTAVALTDHNTVAGLDEFVKACHKYGVEAVPGVEFSTSYEQSELHILALFLKEEDYGRVTDFVGHYQTLKEKSNIETVERLKKDGYPVEYSRIKKRNPDGRINRFHIADELLEKGYVTSVKEAMETLLSPEGKYYIPPERPDSLEVIRFIKALGSVAVLAHPFVSMQKERLMEFLLSAKASGLDAIETEYPLYDEETTLFARETAEKYGLLKSGGSDYHGINKPDTQLGLGKGRLSVPDSFYRDFLQKTTNK